MAHDTASQARPAPSRTGPRAGAHVGKRLLAMLYDLLPVLALWLLASLVFTVAYTLAGHDPRENIQPFSLLQWLLWLCCWLATGAYATASWRHGGQTLGARPWRIRVVSGADGAPPSWATLWRRYAVATLSFAAAGLGFWWAWFDRDRLTWHDRAAGTRVVHQPRNTP